MTKIFVYGDREKMANYANALEGCGVTGVFSLDLTEAKACWKELSFQEALAWVRSKLNTPVTPQPSKALA